MADAQPKQPLTKKDEAGYTHVALDAPAGSEITQPIDPASISAGATDEPIVQETKAAIKAAATKEQQAKQETASALESVKSIEERAIESHKTLEQESLAAKQQIDAAAQQLQAAQAQQKKAQDQLRTMGLKENKLQTKAVAGYKAADLLQVFSKPPEPVDPTTILPPVDPTTHDALNQESNSTKQRLAETQTQVNEAKQAVYSVHESMQNTQRKDANLLRKIVGVLETIQGNTRRISGSEGHKAFLVIGCGVLVMTAVLFTITRSTILLVIIAAAIAHIAMGLALKQKRD